jgi:glyoxylase-like metal-dependent hydrolase (beta-lactamase superfamily II)
VTVAIVDFPEGAFVQHDATGAIVGSLVTDALDEILVVEGLIATQDIKDVKMVFSHSHFDHIGAATITLDHIVDI